MALSPLAGKPAPKELLVDLSRLGKALAQRIIPELERAAEPNPGHDSSTNNLIRRYRSMKSQG